MEISHPIFPRLGRYDNDDDDEEDELIDIQLVEEEDNEEDEIESRPLTNIREIPHLNEDHEFAFPGLVSFNVFNSSPRSNLNSESLNNNNVLIHHNKGDKNQLKEHSDKSSVIEQRIHKLKKVYEKYKKMRSLPNIQKNQEFSMKLIKNNEKFKGLSRILRKCFKKYNTNNPGSSLVDFVKSLNLSKSYYINSSEKVSLTKSLDSLKMNEEEKKLIFLFYGILNEVDYKYILKKRKCGDCCNPFNSLNILTSINDKLDKASEKISENLNGNNSDSESSEQGDSIE